MTEKKSAFAADVEKLRTFEKVQAEKKQRDLNKYLAELELRILASYHVPEAFQKGQGISTAIAAGLQAQRNAWGRYLRSGRFPNVGMEGLIVRPQVNVINGSHANQGIYCVAVDEAADLSLRDYAANLYEKMLAGHTTACSSCRYGMNCLRNKLPRVCQHCRATFTGHEVYLTGQDPRTVMQHEPAICRIQPEEFRVSSSCPLFRNSLVRCTDCRLLGHREHPVTIRVLTEGARYRKKLKRQFTVRKIKPTPASFHAYLRQHQGKSRGSLHTRAQARFARIHKQAHAQQTKPGSARRSRKKRAKTKR